MAKYCVKCGKALPEGVEICPDCNAVGQNESDAALFTMLTSNAEIWRESGEDAERKRQRAQRIQKNKGKIIIAVVAAVLVLAIAFLVLFNLPVSRVQRALDKGEFAEAQSIYSEKLSDSEPSQRTEDKLLAAAERTLAALAAREIGNAEAEEKMEDLRGFGAFTDELFADVEKELSKLYSSSQNMSKAGEAFANGDWLAACDSYLLVAENDALYADAQAKAQECLDKYADQVLTEARGLIEEGEYTAAIGCLKAGDGVLAGYGTFSADIDSKIEDCYKLYEEYILDTAKGLADTEDYVSARETVRVCVEDFGYTTDALAAALEDYTKLADMQLVENTVASAEERYAAGNYGEAFEMLEAIAEGLGEEAETALESAIADFEKRFGEDMCAKADADYNGDRHALADVIAALKLALDIRDLDVIDDKIDELKVFLPFDLIIDPYSEKEGEVNRNSIDFKAIDGSKYGKWMWGRDEAAIEFELDAEYDVFEAIFAVRSGTDSEDDDVRTAYFEIWFDGKLAYTAEELASDDEVPVVPVSVDVTGVKVMKIVFYCDYEASPTENGYSYHAICMPEVYRKDK